MNELKFRLETVREGLAIHWEAQLNNDRPRRHEDCLEAINMTGVSFGDRKIASLIAEKFGYNFNP
jgi:hypothetical protein